MRRLPLHFRKILADISINKTRTMVVVVTIAIGVFAIGTISRSWTILSRNLRLGYQAVNPASGILFTGQFHNDLVEAIREMPEVEEAEGRYAISARVRVGEEQWRSIELMALADYDDLRINKITLKHGEWPPPKRTMLLERSSLALIQEDTASSSFKPDNVIIEMSNGKQRELGIAGVVYDPTQLPSEFSKQVYAYITLDTLKRLTGSRGYNELYVVLASNDQRDIQQVMKRISEKMVASGVSVSRHKILDRHKHPLDGIVQSILFILGGLSIFALFLSACQVLNTISTLLTRQVKQIGIMKAIGAKWSDILTIYLGIVLIFSLLGLMISMPAASLGAHTLTLFLATLLNLDITTFYVPPQIIALEVASALMVPLKTPTC